MKKIILIAYALTCTASLYAGHSKELKLTSPEGVHEVMFRQEKISSSVNEIVYQVKYRGREVIGNSRAGLQLDNRTWELALARKINQNTDRRVAYRHTHQSFYFGDRSQSESGAFYK